MFIVLLFFVFLTFRSAEREGAPGKSAAAGGPPSPSASGLRRVAYCKLNTFKQICFNLFCFKVITLIFYSCFVVSKLLCYCLLNNLLQVKQSLFSKLLIFFKFCVLSYWFFTVSLFYYFLCLFLYSYFWGDGMFFFVCFVSLCSFVLCVYIYVCCLFVFCCWCFLLFLCHFYFCEFSFVYYDLFVMFIINIILILCTLICVYFDELFRILCLFACLLFVCFCCFC